jgi:hypothetical protein
VKLSKDGTKKLLLYKTDLSEDDFRQFLWNQHANIASFYMFVTTTLKFLMCFIMVKLH